MCKNIAKTPRVLCNKRGDTPPHWHSPLKMLLHKTRGVLVFLAIIYFFLLDPPRKPDNLSISVTCAEKLTSKTVLLPYKYRTTPRVLCLYTPCVVVLSLKPLQIGGPTWAKRG